MIARRSVSRLCAGLLLCLPLWGATSQPANATACELNNTVGDLNSDGVADLVMGVPEYNNGRGAVDLLVAGTRTFVTAASLGLSASAPGDRFGSAVAIQDLDMDGCDDLVIGAPGRNSSNGAIYVAFGTPLGGLHSAYIENSPAAHGSFGASLTILAPEKLTPGGWVRTNQQVVVGAPTADDSGQPEAGAVYVYEMMPGDSNLTDMIRIDQDTANVPGVSEAFDRFGTSLAGDGRSIVIGAPGESAGTRSGSGAVTILSATASNHIDFRGVGISQDSPGVPGIAEAGDQFGAAVAIKAGYVVIGVPGEDLGSDTNTGQVQKGRWNQSTRVFTPGAVIDQGTPGIPGENEDLDAFGSALALVDNLHEQTSVAIGVPGEDIGSVINAGSVILVRVNGTPTLPGRRITQNSYGVPDYIQAGDRFGAALGALPGNLDLGEAKVDGLAIGSPGENMGPLSDVGSVTYTRNLTSWHQVLLEDTGAPSIPEESGFGSVLAVC